MVAIRDLKCSWDIAEMAALGKFEEEFIVYGCCYVEDGQVFYRMSTQEDEMYLFVEQCMERGVYPSPVQSILNRTLVPSGMQDEYLYKTKIMLAKQMQEQYPSELLKQFAILAEIDENNSAAELLYRIKKSLVGCFVRERLELVQGIILFAYQQKKLTRQTYQGLQQWLAYVYRQMEDDVVIKKNVQRTFYGLAYRNEAGKVKYFTNARKSEVYKRREQLLCQGIWTTPIVQKTYYFEQQPNLSQIRTEFIQQMGQWMDDDYWQVLDTINQLSTGILPVQWKKLQEQSVLERNEVVEEYFKFYQHMWQLK